MKFPKIASILVVGAVVGCGSSPVESTPPDVVTDLGAQTDTAPEAAVEAAVDVPALDQTPVDVAPDVALDAGRDVPVDVVSDTGSDTGSDAGSDTGSDAASDVASDVVSDVVPMCSGAQTLCAGRCVDTQTDAAHCGACGAPCAAGEVCAAGRCAIACPAAQRACAGACVTLATDPANCGACGTRCAVGASCAASVCECPTGQTVCDGACVDTTSSRAHCGMCSRACAPARAVGACVESVCRVVSCETSTGDCDGDASNGCETDTRTAPAHCGGCGMVCSTGMCSAGTCLSAPSCLRLQTARPTLPSGRYMLDSDGAGPLEPFEAYCDMVTDGGGWTYLATVTNNGDAADRGSWLVSTPAPNAWESPSASFGALDPTVNADYRSVAFHRVGGAALMITHRNQFLLRSDDGCLSGDTLQAHFAARGWECSGSQDFASHPACTHACIIAQAVPRVGDTALLNGAVRARLYLKSGEADGAQDTNRDRSYISTNYRPNVDYPVGLGTFCSGASCTPRVGEADVNDLSDAITPSPGTEFYGLWIR